MVVAVLPNLDKRGAADMVEKIGAFLKNEGITAYLPDNICCADYMHAPEEELYSLADFLITVGGDGTIIRYAKRAALYGKPVLGINAGRMGYLANIEQNEYKLLSKLKNGEYSLEKRMMLDVKVCENGKTINEFTALNEVVITSGFIARIIDIAAFVEGDSINYRADGLIVSTPTGSTAYSMSAGGPIIDPTTENMCITPICSHSLSAKPILLSAERTVKIKAFSKKKSDIFLSVDGRKSANIKPYTEIFITKSPKAVQLLRINDRSFYKTLSAKFSDVRSGGFEK
ncbi:MAG: NAD(+)/NADH kinase [Ruminococcaceae bacterium]|nr:NAD(+)/NADH kinase [Oscillospiraceae bacterium]